MIARLVKLAKTGGLSAEPLWTRLKGYSLDVETGEVKAGTFDAFLSKRSGTKACEVAQPLVEKGANLRTPAFLASQMALALRYEQATGHPLPRLAREMVPKRLAALPANEWVLFAYRGQTIGDIPELRHQVAVEQDEKLRYLPAEICCGCGQSAPVVRFHDGIPALGNALPVLVSFNRPVITDFGDRREGANFPTCRDCMRLYVAYLNRQLLAGRRVPDGIACWIDGEIWVLDSSNGCAFVSAIYDDRRALLWTFALKLNGEKMLRKRRVPDDIDRLPAESSDPAYLIGYLFGILEWAAWVLRLPRTPLLEDVTAAPGRVLGKLIMDVRDAAARYVPPKRGGAPFKAMDPPISNRPTVTAWLQHVLQFATCRLGALPDAPLTPADYAACGLGYAHSLGKRGPSRESYCSTVWTPVGGREPTPWARALMSALEEAGMSFTAECEVDRGEGKKPYSIDVAFPEYRLAVEVDGRLRGLDIRDHVSDSRRTAFLLTRGWIVHRVPNARLNRPDDVDAVVNEIRQIIESINTNKSAKETHAP